MTEWALIIYCGLITFLTRFSMVALLKKEMFNDRVREVLSYVPTAIFPAIIFPAIFLDNSGSILIEDNPKILAAIIFAVLIVTLIGHFGDLIIDTEHHDQKETAYKIGAALANKIIFSGSKVEFESLSDSNSYDDTLINLIDNS